MIRLWHWLDRNIFSLGREMRLSYLPPLMVYMAAGISGLTGIVGTFFVKDYLGLSAAFLAALGFWAGVPWALKMPLGHLVDLIWRWKSAMVFFGAAMIAASLGIMVGLLTDREAMSAMLPPGAGPGEQFEDFGLDVTVRADGRAPLRRELVRRPRKGPRGRLAPGARGRGHVGG